MAVVLGCVVCGEAMTQTWWCVWTGANGQTGVLLKRSSVAGRGMTWWWAGRHNGQLVDDWWCCVVVCVGAAGGVVAAPVAGCCVVVVEQRGACCVFVAEAAKHVVDKRTPQPSWAQSQ